MFMGQKTPAELLHFSVPKILPPKDFEEVNSELNNVSFKLGKKGQVEV
jgi:hypothetical protein